MSSSREEALSRISATLRKHELPAETAERVLLIFEYADPLRDLLEHIGRSRTKKQRDLDGLKKVHSFAPGTVEPEVENLADIHARLRKLFAIGDRGPLRNQWLEIVACELAEIWEEAGHIAHASYDDDRGNRESPFACFVWDVVEASDPDLLNRLGDAWTQAIVIALQTRQRWNTAVSGQ